MRVVCDFRRGCQQATLCLAVMLLSGLVATFIPRAELMAEQQPLVHAPEFPDGMQGLNTDEPLRLADLRGKVVLLDFWTYEPGGVSVAGGKLYIADTNNHASQVANLSTGEVATLRFRGLAMPAAVAAEHPVCGHVRRASGDAGGRPDVLLLP